MEETHHKAYTRCTESFDVGDGLREFHTSNCPIARYLDPLHLSRVLPTPGFLQLILRGDTGVTREFMLSLMDMQMPI